MHSPEVEFFEWIESGAAGCVFAQVLARKRETAGVRTYTYDIPHELIPAAAEHMADETLREFGQAEALAFLFPRIKAGRHVAVLLNELARQPDWSLVDLSRDFPVKNEMSVGLRWRQPNYRFVSFALGFADIATMPATRSAPSVALVIRPNGLGSAPGIIAETRGEIRSVQHLESGRIPVHLADMETTLTSPKKIATTWTSTETLKQRKLSQCPHAEMAKAKVTFHLPASCRKHMPRLNHAS